MKPLRICYLAHGGFHHVDPYLDFFSSRGHDVQFVALGRGPRRSVPTHDLSLHPAMDRLCGKLSYLPALLRVRGVVRSLRPDIVHAHYATSAGLAALLCGLHPWIVTAHGTDLMQGVHSTLRRNLLRRILLGADCVNPVSEGLRRIVLRLEVPETRIETFSLGIDTARFKFRPHRFPSASLKLLCTRKLEPVYDHATIIRSMGILKGRSVPFHLTLLGGGTLRRELEALTRQLRLTEEVTFGGAVPNQELPSHLENHSIYLSASRWDGTSLSLLEAMASGLYPVVSEIEANAYWVRHEVNGLLHKVSDPQSLADCIVALTRNGKEIGQVLHHNRQLVLDKADRPTNLQRLERIYFRLQSCKEQAPPVPAHPARLN